MSHINQGRKGLMYEKEDTPLFRLTDWAGETAEDNDNKKG